MNKLYFLDAWSPDLDLSHCRIISLNPKVSLELTRKKLTYEVLGDLEFQRGLVDNQDSYFESQIQWFQRADILLQSHIGLCKQYNIEPFRAHFSRLRYILDTFVVNTWALKECLNRFKPAEVYYYGPKPPQDGPGKDLNHFRDHSQDVIRLLLPTICEQLGIKRFSATYTSKSKKQSSHGISFRHQVKSVLLALGGRQTKSFLHYKKWRNLKPKPKKDSKNFLFLDASNPAIDSFLTDLMHAGHSISIANDAEIRVESQLISNTHTPSKAGDWNHLKVQCDDAYSTFMESQILDEINQQCGLSIDQVLQPYFESFITENCFDFVRRIFVLRDYFKMQPTDYLVARSSAGSHAASFLMAARTCGVKTVCLQHGHFVFHASDLAFHELDLFDIYLSSDSLNHHYFVNQCAQKTRYKNKIIIQHAVGLKQIQDRKKKLNAPQKPILLYLEKKFPAYRLRNNTATYFLPWYFEFQKAILNYLNQRTDYEVIYKHYHNEKWPKNSTLPYIPDYCKNIHIEDAPFSKHLDHADRVLLDFPSTGYFECLAAGISTLCLRADFLRVWKPTQQSLGKGLQAFPAIPDALEKIKAFLDGPAEDYQPKISLETLAPQELLTKMESGETFSQTAPLDLTTNIM